MGLRTLICRLRGAAARRDRTPSAGPALVALLALLALAPLAACKTGPDLSVDYGQTAEENYELALGEFADKDWEEAVTYADFVRIRFPFSRYAVEAELLVARAQFEQGNYAVAQDAFKQFGRLHPTHRHVRNGWVAYMTAASAFMNAPDGVGIMPPYYQRDQNGLSDALTELGYFFDHYDSSPMHENAVKLRDEVNRRLLQHELYVARFYLDKDRPEAAIGRLERAHKDFPGIGLDAEVLFLLGLTYLNLEEIELSRSTFSELQSQHPGHHHGKQARLYLKYIYDTYGPADPSRARPDRSPPKPQPPARPKNLKKPSAPEDGQEQPPFSPSEEVAAKPAGDATGGSGGASSSAEGSGAASSGAASSGASGSGAASSGASGSRSPSGSSPSSSGK